MKSNLLGLTLTATILLGVTGPAAATTYSVQTVIDPSGTNFINLLGINNGGTIAGTYGAIVPQGFTLVLPNTFTTENFPGAASTTVTAINGSGDTAGFYTDTGGNTHGFTKISGTFTTVDAPGTVFNQALGINNAQTTVGYSSTAVGGMTGQIAYSQHAGTFTIVNALLPSNVNSQAVGINNAGDIVGFYMPTATTSIGFLDNGGTITTIDPFGSLFTQALGINTADEIVGFYVDAGGVQHGYIDDSGIFTTFDPSGSVSTTINGVNDLGQIVGFYTDANDDVVGFVGSPTPIPMALPLFATGLGGLGLLGWRRKRKNAAALSAA